MRLAKLLERLFFPSHVVLAGGLALLHVLGWRLLETAAFLASSLVYAGLVRLLKADGRGEKPYALAGAGALAVYCSLHLALGLRWEMAYAAASLLVMLIAAYYTRVKWRVSGHVATLAGVAATLAPLSRLSILAFILVPVLAWSRLELKAHTPLQVLAGAALGLLAPSLVWLVFTLYLGYRACPPLRLHVAACP